MGSSYGPQKLGAIARALPSFEKSASENGRESGANKQTGNDAG
jgi:hypothetical protein